ncbi:WD repeat-containing protein 44 [Trichinella murrelli]|uniref:WD repeat-containing protein 44 n=1 Tax=Trichinella murrelli TaxID=144512 RepID=A0A0V0TSG4_9BILA|nr:WD repeat-containing protein 44 [Trichinella murrelli]
MPSCVSRFAGAMSSCSPIEPANQNIVRNILYKHRTVVISVVKIMPPKRAVAAKRATVSKNEAVNDKKKAVQRKKKVYSLAPVLPDAEILTDAKKQKWLLGKHFASGGFGRIHFVEKVDDKCKAVAKIEFATNGPLYTEMHYYQRAAGLDKLSEWKKQHGLDFLGLPPLLGFGTHCNAGNDYRFLVIPQFGPNLEYVRMKLGGKFSISSVTRLAVNCLNIYEYLHNQGYAYADLKGDNMVLEQLEPVDYKKEVKIWQSYLIDFGLVYRVTLGAALKLDPKKAHQGTREYTSLDAHYGATPSFRSDLEILGYNILFWLNGDLPWLSSTSDIDVMKKKENFKENLEKESLKFMETGQLSICVPILKKFFAYTYDLDYGSLPDYTFLRNLFKTVEITTEADNNSSTKKLRSSSNKSTMSPAQHPGPSKAMRTCRATELKRKCASSSKTNANKSKQKQVRDSENQQSENRRSDRFAHLGIIPGMANFRTKSLAQSLIRRKSVAQSVVDKYVTISRSNAVPRRHAEEIERDFAELRLSLLNSARELYVHEERNSLGLTWGQKLLLQADNGSASTSVAQDTLSTKGSSENRASSQVTLKRSRSSQSSHDNDLHQLQNSVSRLCSSAGNSRNSTLEKFLPAELSALEAALEDDNHFVDHATSSTPKTRSLTRDVDVSVLKNCKSVFPMEELMKLQRKYSSAEMVIDALTNEYKLSGGFSVSGSEVDSFSNVDTPPVRPPRRRKNLQHQLLMNKLKISTEVEETPPKQITTVKSPETFLKPLPVFDEDKMGQRNVAKLDHIKRISSGCCNPGVNPLSLHMLRKSKGNLSGSLDGKIRLWLIPEKKVCFWNELDEGQMVTAVTYVRKGDLVVVGTYDGRCLIYTADKLSYHAQIDIRKSTLKGCHGSKITGLDSYRDKLLITCNDSRIRLYDLRDLSLCCKYRGFMNKSSQIRAQFNHNGQFVISGSEDSMVYLWKTHVELGTLPLPIRKDRSCRWERIKAHRAVVTAASFAPNPRLIFDQIDRTRNKTPEEPLPDKSPSPPLTIDTQSVPEVIVSADFVGCVYVYINKPRLCRYNSLMISVFYRPFRPSNLSIVRTWCNRVDLTEQQTIATAVDDAQNNFDLAQRPFGYGVDATSVRLNWWESNQRFTFWAKWAMRRDWRRRQVIAEYNDVRIRMKAILRNDFLPTAIRQEMKQEMQKLPRCCFPRYVRNICQITGRKRGNMAMICMWMLSSLFMTDLARCASLTFLHVPKSVHLPSSSTPFTSEVSSVAGTLMGLNTDAPKEWLNSGDLFQRAEAMVVFDIVAPDHLKPNLQSLKTYRLNEDSTPEFSTLWLEIQKTFSENDPTLIESSMNGVNSGNDIPIASTYDDTPALFAQGSSDELPLDKETKATLAIKSWLEENKTVRNGVPDLYLFNFESLLWIVEQQHTATNSQEVRDAIAKIETLITKLTDTFKNVYDDNCIVLMVSSSGARSRKPRQLSMSDKELQNSYTRYSFYSQDYAVTFNIIFWLMFSFIITIMFIGVGMWTMSPGRDSLIYQ